MNYSYCVQQRRQLIRLARQLASYGCAGVDQEPDDTSLCGKCGPCEATRWLEEHNQSKPSKLPALNEKETALLREMPNGGAWLRPMDFGGRDGSDHSAVLMRLVEKGYVEMKEWGGHSRMSWRYRKVEVSR